MHNQHGLSRPFERENLQGCRGVEWDRRENNNIGRFSLTLKEQLMTKSVNPKHYPTDPQHPSWTTPKTWGTYSLPDQFVSGRKRKYRYGNHPVRLKELKRDYDSVDLIALFENRDDAKLLADLLENE